MGKKKKVEDNYYLPDGSYEILDDLEVNTLNANTVVFVNAEDAVINSIYADNIVFINSKIDVNSLRALNIVSDNSKVEVENIESPIKKSETLYEALEKIKPEIRERCKELNITPQDLYPELPNEFNKLKIHDPVIYKQ